MTRQHIARWAGGALALLLATGFCLLGVWQLERGQFKQARLDAHARALQQAPLPLAAALSSPDQVQPVAGCGQWLAPVLVLDNQQQDGQPGHRSYQAWRSDAGPVLLVERGWRAWDGRRSPPQVAALTGQACLQGLLLPWPAPGLRAAAQDHERLADGSGYLLARLDHAAVAALLDSEPGSLAVPMLRPARALGTDPAPAAAVLPNTLPPEKHLGYAVQWFGLALTVVVLAIWLCWRRRSVARSVRDD